MDEIVERAMDRKAGRRFGSAAEMAEALQKCLDSGQRLSATGRWRRILFSGGETGRETPTPPPAIEERRRTDISSTCHRVEDLIEQHLFNEAGSVLEAGFRNHPEEPDFIGLRNRLQRQRQQYDQAIAQQAELVRDLLNRGLAEEAMKVADNALAMHPRAAALAELQRECRRRVDLANAAVGGLAQVRARIEEMIAAAEYQQATDHVLELLAAGENQIELNKLLARILQARKGAEKQAAIAQYVSDGERAAGAGEWESALGIVDGGLERFAGDTKLRNFRRTLSERWQAERRRVAVEAAIAEARELEVSTSLQAARERLARELDALERDPALVGELERIDAAIEAARRDASIGSAVEAAAALRGERKLQDALDLLDRTVAREGRDTRIDRLRITVAAELRAQEAQIARTAAAARQSIRDLKWEEAVLGLSAAVRDLPGERVLSDLMQEAQRGLAQKRREETIARIKAEAGGRAAAREYAEAIRLLLDAVSQCPEDSTLSAALSQTVIDRDAYIAAGKTKAALDRASRLRGEGRFENAIEAVLETLWELPDNPELQGALARLESEWREIRRRTAIGEITAVVEAGIAAEDHQPALERLARGLAEWPGEPELLNLDRRTRSSQRRTETREALREALDKGGACEAAEDWNAAARIFERTLAAFPETAAELEPRRTEARAQALAAQRKARLAELDRALAEWFDAGLLDEAEKELQGAAREFPDEAGLAAWREKITSERRRIAREAAIRNAVDRARWLLDRQSFDEAESVLAAAVRECGADGALRDAAAAVEAARSERAAAIESALARIQALCDAHDWDAAIADALRSTERFPDEARLRALLAEARRQRELARRAIELDRQMAKIDAMLGENAFDEAEKLLRHSLRDYAGEAALEERRRRLEEARAAQALDAAFRQSMDEVERLCQERQWAQARQLATPYLDQPRTEAAARARIADLTRRETQYRARARKLMKRARTLIDSERNAEALSLLEAAAIEFSEMSAFANMLVEIREGATAAQRAGRLSAAENAVRSLLVGRKHAEALEAADRALGEFPGEKALRDLRALIEAGAREQAAVGEAAGRVRQLAEAGEGSKADRALVEALRRYPGRMELERLRAPVDAARQAEWERQSREAAVKRAISGIDKALGRAKLEEAGAALAAFEAEYGKEAAAEAAKRVAAAIEEAERERQRLAEEERSRQLEEHRQKEAREAQEAAFRACADEVERLCGLRQFKRARLLVTPYLDQPATKPSAEAALARLLEREAEYRDRNHDLDQQARALLGAKRYPDAVTLLEGAIGEFPENAELPRLLQQAREGGAAERKAQRLSAAERGIRTSLAGRRFEEALETADAALGEYPGEPAVEGLRAGIVAAMAERTAVAAAGDVERSLEAGDAAHADQVLVEALRRYPGRMELEKLRAAVDAARKAEWERQAREAGRKRAVASIERLLAEGKAGEAGAALEALRKEHGDGAAAELAERVGVAVAEADRRRLAEEERAREAERERLAAEERRNRQLEEQRRGQAMETAFRRSVGEVARLCRQRQFEQARQLVEPYLEHPKTQSSAKAVLAEMVKQEAQYHARLRDLEEQARALIAAGRHREAVEPLERAAGEFPEAGELGRLLRQAREGAK
jgi:hypothetical protein